MFRRFAVMMMGILALTSSLTFADDLSPKPAKTEVSFVRSVQKDLSARFPTVASAERAGYFRYTNEDKTGAISYANLSWTSSDPQHPSQLWYSASGKLLGADYSVPYADAKPNLWGIEGQRWERFGAHVHYILTDANGKETYGATSVKKFETAGGDSKNPTADTLVKMSIAKNATDVKRVFLFPAVWDLELWVMPNPNGAFAEMNPNVKPSANASDMDM